MSDTSSTRAMDIAATANLLRLLGHPVRLGIALQLLSGPCTVSSLESCLKLKQPNLSQHLAVLRDAGIVTSTREAKSVTYEIADGHTLSLLQALLGAARDTRDSGVDSGALPYQRQTHYPDGDALVFATVKHPVRSAADHRLESSSFTRGK